MRLSNLKIGVRLYMAFGVIVAMLVALVVLAEVNFSRLGTANSWNVHTYEVLGETNALQENLIDMETGQRGFSLTGNETSLEPFNAGKASFTSHMAKIAGQTSDNPAQQQRLADLAAAEQNWLATVVEPAITLRRSGGDQPEAMAAVVQQAQSSKGKAAMDAMRVQLAAIRNSEQLLLQQRSAELSAQRTRTDILLIGGGIVAALLAAVLAYLLTRNITLPLQRAVALAQRVAKGDLSSQVVVTSKDETGELMQALSDMNAALYNIVQEVRSGTDTIATASAQISAGNMDLSSRTEQQAGSLEETASSMEELTATVKQNADHAQAARDLASSASSVAVRGGAMVAEVVTTMGSINDSARKIVDIIGVIDSIAFQTNILALNAAVEAARAGEQGRGFAVVASEVRNLAQRSASAAREIKVLIDDSVNQVETGSKLVDRAGATMQEVVDSVKKVNHIISDIAAASAEQRQGIEQVNDAITQMDQVTQQNAALVEQAAAASNALQEQAATLAHAVSVFQLAAVTPAPAVGRNSRPARVQHARPARPAGAMAQLSA